MLNMKCMIDDENNKNKALEIEYEKIFNRHKEKIKCVIVQLNYEL